MFSFFLLYRVYVEKKEGLDNEARALLGEARSLLGIEGLEAVRLFNRYDDDETTTRFRDYTFNFPYNRDDEETTEEETTAEETTAEKTETTTTAPDDKEGGCGSFLAGGAAIVALTSIVGVAYVTNRKED